jgi:hypothetical protein
MNLKAVELAVINKWSQTIINEIYREWNIRSTKGNAEATAEIKFLGDGTIVNFVGKGQKAWILEYGKGSLIDADNPYLRDYVTSEIYNQLRPANHTVVKREVGWYSDLDGNMKYSDGINAGRDLEKIGGVFSPQPALHIIRNSVLVFLPEIMLDLADAYAAAILNGLPDVIDIKL